MISSQTDMKKGRRTDMNAHRHKDRKTKYIITGRQEDRQTCKPEFVKTGRHKNRKTGRQKDRKNVGQ